MLAPPLKLLGGGGLVPPAPPPPPVPTPMMYQNNSDENIGKVETQAKTRISLRICAVWPEYSFELQEDAIHLLHTLKTSVRLPAGVCESKPLLVIQSDTADLV